MMVREVESFGEWITPQGAAPIKENMKAGGEWETSQDLKGVSLFLGFTKYSRQFVLGYAEMASPLTYKERCAMDRGTPSVIDIQGIK